MRYESFFASPFFMNMSCMAGMIFLLPQSKLVGGGQPTNVSANTCLSLNHLNAALVNSIEDLCYMKATGQHQS